MFPVAEASWRIPIVMFPGAVGMAAGGWIAGLIYDRFGFYAPSFAAGIAFNLVNLALIGTLVPRHRPPRLGAPSGSPVWPPRSERRHLSGGAV
jgi:hypothetical protein